MTRSLRTLKVLTFLLVAFILTCFWLFSNYGEARQRHDHSIQVLRLVSSALSAFQDMVTASRGYALTQDPQFLQKYETVQKERTELLDKLKQLTIDNAAIQALVADLGKEAQVLDAVTAKLLESGDGPQVNLQRRVMENIRKQFWAIADEEHAFLVRRHQRSQMYFEIAISSLITVLMLGLVLLYYVRHSIKRYTQEAEARLEHRAFLAQLGTNALEGMPLDDLFTEAVTNVSRIFQNEYCKILELQPDEKCFLLRAGVGWHPGLVGVAKVDAGQNFQAGYTLLSKQPVIVTDLRTDERFSAPALLEQHAVISGMSVTIPGADQPWGIIGTHTSKPHTFTEYDVKFFQAVANALGSAIQRKKYEERIMQQTHEIIHARDEAVLASEAKSRFLATISHEVRTPMAGVIGLVELIADSATDENTRTLAKTAFQSCKRLLRILNDLLDASELQAGKLALEYRLFAVRPIIGDVIQLLFPEAEKKNLTITSEVSDDIPKQICGDELRLKQILLNLLHNAVKFTSAGRVSITVTVLEKTQTTAKLAFVVQDTGAGISAEQKKRLFQPFEQAEDSTGQIFGGTGLGLHIAASLTELMGGQIGVESQPDSGTLCWVHLPFSNELCHS